MFFWYIEPIYVLCYINEHTEYVTYFSLGRISIVPETYTGALFENNAANSSVDGILHAMINTRVLLLCYNGFMIYEF